eukprot:TRINITY_DN3128_c0_g1_i9.p1 TRINITY_DN3128_c0_g1~~TRINITY_DN3128_c0_g1_i9.p1  ORF type:complete len:714 (+),score=153.67 TRINITY_DN3128_c0_g1_i9:1602-3743(+)
MLQVEIGEGEQTRFFCADPYNRDVQFILEHYRTSKDDGISAREFNARYSTGPRNVIEEKEDDPLYKKYFEQFTEPLIVLLLVSALVSIFLGQFDDAISIVAAVIIVSTVAFVQEYKSEQAIKALSQFVTHNCHVIRDGRVQEIRAETLVNGDLVVVNQGDRIPADLRLIECTELTIDESILTGENEPRRKDAQILKTDNPDSEYHTPFISERHNMAFMGTMVNHGKGKGIVVGVGSQTEFGKISQMIQEVEDKKSPLQIKMDQLGKHLSVFSFAIIGVIFVIGLIQGQNMLSMFNVGVSLAVAAIPEGLPIVVTVTLALGVTRMSKRNAIVRKLPAVESLGATSVICVDKTGTLTCNEMTVTNIFSGRMLNLNVDNDGSVQITEAQTDAVLTNPLSDQAIFEMLKTGILCNNSYIENKNGVSKIVGQPTEGALLTLANRLGLSDFRRTSKRIHEIPFDSEKKWMAVQYEDEGTNQYYVKGALEAILPRCTSFSLNSNISIYPTTKYDVEDAYQKMASKALRVMALAKGNDLNNLTLLGLVGLTDPPRIGVKEAVKKTKESGIKVVMLTGDSKETAIAIARNLGFYDDDQISLSCQEMEEKSESELAKILPHVSVFYRMAPGHKMKIVKAFRASGKIVAMTGDGVNDAPALKISDIGVAMGNGSDICKEVAEIVLVDNNFATIVNAVEEGKVSEKNKKQKTKEKKETLNRLSFF